MEIPPVDQSEHFATLAAVRASLSRGSDEGALALLKSAPPPTKAAAHLLRAKFLKNSRQFKDAANAVNLAESLSATGAVPLELFSIGADIFLKMHDFDNADALILRGLALHSDAVQLLLRRALVLAAQKNLQGAEDHICRAFKSDKYSPVDDAYLSNAMRALQNISASKAFTLINEIAQRHPNSGAIARLKGDIAARVKEFQVAIDSFNQAIGMLKPGAMQDAAFAGLERVLKAQSKQRGDDLQQAVNLSNINPRPFLICAITNVYNEKFNLPIWLGHYGSQVGLKNCIVLDNGTDDGSTDELGAAGRVPMPRGSTFNERHRMKIITDLANNLLNYYDAVIYSDCDEILVPHPLKYENLIEYCGAMKSPVVHAVGLNVREDITQDLPIDLRRPILIQRTLVQFVSAMCKPLVTRTPISWGGGFHSCDHPPYFNDLYLFHLRHLDLGQALERLSITRQIAFAREGGGKHHRREDLDLATKMYASTHKMPVVENFDFTQELEAHKSGIELSFSGRYAVKRAVNCKHLFRIPDYFRFSF